MTNSFVEPSLAKKLILHNNPTRKVSSEAVKMAAELLRLFIVEARLRAAIEAECENEGTVLENSSPCDDNGLSGDSLGHVVSIRADHISKVAAELLMDFS